MLQGGGESELDTLALLVASVGADQLGSEAELGIRVGLEPDGLGQRLGRNAVRIRGRGEVDRQDALGTLLDRPQAGVGGDRVEPGTEGAAALEAGESAPGAQERLLEGVLRVVQPSIR